MRTQAFDTDPRVEAIQIGLLREAGTARRLRLTADMIATVREMQRCALRRMHPDFSDEEIAWKAAALNYGSAFVDRARAWVAARRRSG